MRRPSVGNLPAELTSFVGRREELSRVRRLLSKSRLVTLTGVGGVGSWIVRRWYVDETVWPDGLHPLVKHVRGLGMEFGLWVGPEMVNPDSDLARAHPEWLMATGRAAHRPGAGRGGRAMRLRHSCS